MLEPALKSATSSPCAFTTTHWTVVLAAKQGDPSEAAAAMEKLCRTYWRPLYAFLRREGRTPHDAQDLTQEFFARLLKGGFLEKVGPHKGKFRSFLLAALKNFLCDEWDKAKAAKRGGGERFISLDEYDAEELFLHQANSEASAEQVFEQRWALSLLAQALARVREEFTASGKIEEFDRLKIFLSTPTSDGAYDAVAGTLGLAAETVAVRVHRLRQRYGEFIRAEIAQTVASPGEIEQELQHLFQAVGK